MKLRLEWPDDGGAIEVEADTFDELLKVFDPGIKVLWGKSARQLSAMTMDEADVMMGRSPRR